MILDISSLFIDYSCEKRRSQITLRLCIQIKNEVSMDDICTVIDRDSRCRHVSEGGLYELKTWASNVDQQSCPLNRLER